MSSKLKTAVIGFGKVSAGYAENPDMRKYYRYCTHAQVLMDHPSFNWDTVVDPDEDALALAGDRYNIPNLFQSVDEMIGAVKPDVIVLATPPEGRLEILQKLEKLKGLMLEKPLGKDLDQSQAFVNYCIDRRIPVQAYRK